MWERSPEYEAYQKVLRETRGAAYTYQRLQWRDSVASLARSSGEEGNWVAVALPAGAPEGYGPGMEAAIREQLGSVGVADPRIPVGVLFIDAVAQAHPQAPPDVAMINAQEEVMVSTGAGNPFCFVVVPVRGVSEGTLLALERKWTDMVSTPPGSTGPPRPLGPCLLHAKYGTPGPRIFRWLWDGAYTFGMGDWGRGATLPSGEDSRFRRDLFGLRLRHFTSNPSLPLAEACLMGQEDACRKSVAGGPPHDFFSFYSYYWSDGDNRIAPDGSPLAFQTRLLYSLAFGSLDAFLLWDLEAEFGSERFQRFWSSEEGVEEAFQAAFGEPLGRWVMRWAQERIHPMTAAAPVPPGASLLTLLTVCLLAGMAVLVQRRRA
jgi:hypothetical protein